MKKLLIAVLLAAAAVPVHSYLFAPAPLIAYRAEVDEGDTVWTMCARIASDADNMEEVVDRTMRENHITDAAKLLPGQELVIRVKEIGK